MDDTTVNLMDIVVPGDDGEISRTLAELEGKLEAWTAAVAEVRSALAEGVASAPVATTPEPPADEPVEPDIASGDEGSSSQVNSETGAEPAEEVCAAEDATPEPVEEAADEQPDEIRAEVSADTSEPVAAKHDMLGRPTSEVQPAPEVPRVSQDTKESEASASQEEEEALLNSLDPEMARAIRVMRRVSPVKKSIQELIEEHEATHSSRKAASSLKKKSWWARG